ncbi:MAG: XRE family transcriptional regulator [Erysipelotrichaceae bacterium]|nr:XRE family transcriptional regulator [Erysipelotrichaceae bacterium]MDD3924754.1 XRE family transcriptional regulator [Erysipelotrichaceae bacterium]MDD4643026.1 XRE family transcriptional regulator [Erysipelotrichaceae bacterium]
MEIGKRIKQLRTRNNLTLEELASRCELTKGFLSQLERDLTSPSIATLQDIVEALGLSMMEFFKDEKNEKIVFNKDDFFTDEKEGSTIHWIVPNAQKNEMEPILIELKPHQSSHTISPHEGEEFGYVLSGKIVLYNGDKKYVVRKGNTFYIKGNYNHYLRNEGTQTASVLWICTPPIF